MPLREMKATIGILTKIMKTLYYINGKQVNINTYYNAIGADAERKYLWKRCVKYYSKHSFEFQLLSSNASDSSLPIQMMTAWEHTSDYKDAMKEVQKMRDNDKGCMLWILIIMSFFVVPFVLIAMQDKHGISYTLRFR